GFRDHAVGIGLGLVALAHLVFPGTDHVVKRILHFSRCLGALDVHLHHGDAGLVVVQITLQALGGGHAHLLPPLGQHIVHRRRADHVTQRTLGRVPQTGFGILDLEHEVLQVGDPVLDRQWHLNDVLVFGQHLPLLAVRTDRGDVALEFLLEWREVDMQTRLDGTVVLTQSQNHGLLLLIHHVDGIEQPDHEQQQYADDPDALGYALAAADLTAATATTGTLLVAEYAVQAVLQLAQSLVQIRWPLLAAAVVAAATVATAPPGVLVVRIVTATRLIPRHSVLRCPKL